MSIFLQVGRQSRHNCFFQRVLVLENKRNNKKNKKQGGINAENTVIRCENPISRIMREDYGQVPHYELHIEVCHGGICRHKLIHIV